jgi:AraC-like DNA-binding protein
MDSASADSSSVLAHFLRGVDFIEDHLLEPVALADAAKQAGVSLHYSSRLFRALRGDRSARICGGGA